MNHRRIRTWRTPFARRATSAARAESHMGQFCTLTFLKACALMVCFSVATSGCFVRGPGWHHGERGRHERRHDEHRD